MKRREEGLKPIGLPELGTDRGLVAARGIREFSPILGCTHKNPRLYLENRMWYTAYPTGSASDFSGAVFMYMVAATKEIAHGYQTVRIFEALKHGVPVRGETDQKFSTAPRPLPRLCACAILSRRLFGDIAKQRLRRISDLNETTT